MSKKNIGKFLTGAAIGVGLGFLFAPKKGSETRKDLKKKSCEVMDKIKSTKEGGKNREKIFWRVIYRN